MNITQEERKRLKGQGILSNRDEEHFSARIITENGVLNARQMINLGEAAKRYGNGNVAFTARMTLEIQGITYENIEKLQTHIQKEGMMTGGTGNKVRPVVACKGTVCVYGLLDTQGLAKAIHRRFYEGYRNVALPHKFKIAVGGCPNNCVKPDLNDIGIMGQRVPAYENQLCRGCKKCNIEDTCPMGAAKIADGILTIDSEMCNNCGLCIGKCHFKAIPGGMAGCKIYVGGRWGKKTRPGNLLSRVYTPEEALDMVEKAILYYKEQGRPGERFGAMIDRLGIDTVEKALEDDALLQRKTAILEG